MRRRFVHVLIVAAFSLGVGRVAWRTLGPYPTPEDVRIGGTVMTLRSPDADAKNLYLRRTLYLPKRPRSAWVQVLGRDELHVLINGTALRPRLDPGRTVAIVADIAPYLRAGKNVLAIFTRKRSVADPPAVAVEGGYRLGNENSEFRIDTDGPWRCRTFYDRGATHWHSIDFDDSQWSRPALFERHLVARATAPVGAITEPIEGRWIMPDDPIARNVFLRNDFNVPHRPTQAWLRLWSRAPYRLAVNGHVIDVREDQLATTRDMQPIQWIYDISPLIRRGANFISLALRTDRPPPRIRADLSVKGGPSGSVRVSSSDEWSWVSAGDAGASVWLAAKSPTSTWKPVHVAEGDMGLQPWEAPRRIALWSMPDSVKYRRGMMELAAVLILAMAVYTLTALVGRFIERPEQQKTGAISLAMLALVVPAGLSLSAILLTFDPRVPDQIIYRTQWLYAIAGLVVIQWLCLAGANRLAGRGASRAAMPTDQKRRSYLALALVLGLVSAGGFLRVRTMAVEELSPDEISVYRQATGFLERGFPSVQIHEDLPIVYTATSELVYFGSALTTFFTDDERLIVRTPTVIWGTLTILLIYLTGRLMFGPWVGITAAAIYTFSPLCLEMCHIGRYYSQLQVFVLLTVYFFYRTIAPTGPLNRRMLALTVVTFVCMYLSWEGSALIAPGLVAAALLHRRDRLRTIFGEPGVWIGSGVVLGVVVVQSSHRTCIQTLRMLYGSGSTDVALTAMWSYPGFDPWYYVRLASWSADALLPIFALFAAVTLAARYRHRAAVRILLVLFLVAAFVHAIVLPVTAKRYTYDLLPMFTLLASAAVVAMAERLASADVRRRSRALCVYARCVGGVVVILFVVMGCSAVVQFDELPAWRGAGSNPDIYRVPEHEAASQFVAEHLEPGDIVISNVPHATDRYLGRKTDYWVQTQLHLQAILDDKRAVPLHRLTGTPMIANVGQLKEVFTRHPRIWFISFPSFHGVTNTKAGSAFISEQMDVVYEGFGAVVFFRESRHRPAVVLDRGEAALRRAGKPLLP